MRIGPWIGHTLSEANPRFLQVYRRDFERTLDPLPHAVLLKRDDYSEAEDIVTNKDKVCRMILST